MVIAVVRSLEKATALKALGKKNVHAVKGDITDVASIEVILFHPRAYLLRLHISRLGRRRRDFSHHWGHVGRAHK